MKKLLGYDWLRAVQLLGNSVQSLKANKSTKIQKFL